ncbi:4Fe-4S binding protein [Aureivirga sp. CE67]|uniref:4Fe-4S binding protein n=1 Tax=Aureivirga sp. CE67 TaxID=1788983 RepID=UPI0018CB99A7|nr:4Fe-4S dicluster domain-containing protein [Aureivirga sp. CE67]
MKIIKHIGLGIFIIGLLIFTSLIFVGKYELTENTFDSFVKSKGLKSELFINDIQNNVVGKEYSNPFALSSDITSALENANKTYKKEQKWDKVIWDSPHELSYNLMKPSAKGLVVENQGLFFFLTFGLGIIGALMFIIPDVVLLGPAGIKNDGIYHNKSTNRGWIGWITAVYLVTFYIILYFFADYIVNLIYLVNPISKALSGNGASQWFLYGFLYCTVMTVMAVRMFIKYRHNKYQIIRTASVLFFQIGFAFLIPEILVRFNMPYFDFKNAWPLDYDFFFDWNIKSLINSGTLGIFMLVWGTIFSIIIIPIFVYFYGKRWYCSWVCGCGGLAETLGDPYRQLSDKSVKSWKIERYLIHAVLVFAIIMTAVTLYTFFSGVDSFFGIKTYEIQKVYGFLIGSIFAGVIGTGFYPVMGNRVWCRFGCPLAAYMGIVQRFKSRFRITTNGGQCISCGNCSTYCEQGIDVRSYAQKGQNIVRASCVGCGVCSAVCPRGVLKLENGPEEGRIQENPTLLGNDIDLMKMLKDK